jgi:hypothetical protein
MKNETKLSVNILLMRLDYRIYSHFDLIENILSISCYNFVPIIEIFCFKISFLSLKMRNP